MGQLSAKLRGAADGYTLFFCPGCEDAHAIRVGTGPGPRWAWNGNADASTRSRRRRHAPRRPPRTARPRGCGRCAPGPRGWPRTAYRSRSACRSRRGSSSGSSVGAGASSAGGCAPSNSSTICSASMRISARRASVTSSRPLALVSMGAASSDCGIRASRYRSARRSRPAR